MSCLKSRTTGSSRRGGTPVIACSCRPNADGTYPKETHASLPSLLYDKHKPQVLFGGWWDGYDRTMPLKGTHSLEPSLRGRGLRLSGSCSKAASTQSATASALGVIVERAQP